jgi:transposase InsO family protein
LLKNLSTSVGQWTSTRGITHLNIAKGRKESNGKVENSNKMIDYELLPLIHNVESDDIISRITNEYTELHN